MENKVQPGAGVQPGHELNLSNYLSNSAADQRSRLKTFLKRYGSITTIEARQELDILHPAGRVMELRQHGCDIITTRVEIPTIGKRTHRVARYVWRGEVLK